MEFSEDSENQNKMIQYIPSLNYTPDPRGLGYIFFTHMSKHKDRVAQICGLTGEEDTFGNLLQRCVRTTINMRSKGVTSNDVVTLCSFNHLNSCVPYLSALFVGAKVASLDPTLSPADTAHLLKQVTPKLIFVIPEAVELIENALSEIRRHAEIVVFGHTTKHTPFSDFLKPSDEESTFEPAKCRSLRDTALIVFSSGTSGLPKGICINHFNYVNQVWNSISFGHCYDVILSFASPYWGTSILFLGISIIAGVSRLVVPKFDSNTVWKTIHKHKPTFTFMAPTQVLEMFHKGRPEEIDTSSLKDILIGGGPILKQQVVEIRAAFPRTRVHAGYGQTEVFGFSICFKPSSAKDLDHIERKPDSCGTGVTGMSYKVVDPETEQMLGSFQQGELRIKTEYQMNGYYNVDSSEAWDSEGWLRTGDIAYYDQDHCFFIVDRIKEMLKFQSWHVQPIMLESILITHPDVVTAVVVGIPHETDGDHPMAVVVLKETANAAFPEEIEKFLEEKVHDRQRLRGGVKIVNKIPTTPNGKIKRSNIRDLVLQGKI